VYAVAFGQEAIMAVLEGVLQHCKYGLSIVGPELIMAVLDGVLQHHKYGQSIVGQELIMAVLEGVLQHHKYGLSIVSHKWQPQLLVTIKWCVGFRRECWDNRYCTVASCSKYRSTVGCGTLGGLLQAS